MVNNIDLTQQIQTILKNTINPLTAEAIQTYQQRTNGTIDFILTLCHAYTAHLDMVTANTYLNKYGTKSANVQKSQHQYTWAELNTYGARIIYLIRYLLHEEGISFLIGATNGKKTKQILISQYEAMQLMGTISKKNVIGIKASQLSEMMKVISAKQKVNNRRNQWQLVMKLGSTNKYNKFIRKHRTWIDYSHQEVNEDALGVHIIYQNNRADNQVWVKFSGKNHQRSYYYQNGSDFKFYNMGWLWQWYNAILMGEDEALYNTMVEGLAKKSIAPIIGSTENIAGTKTGDLLTANNNYVQAKLDNERIISYNNIKVILIELTKALEAWKDSNYSQDGEKNVMQVIQEHFFEDGVLIANDTAQQGYNEIINRLTSGLSNTLILT